MSYNTHEGIRNLSPVSSIYLSLSLVLLFYNTLSAQSSVGFSRNILKVYWRCVHMQLSLFILQYYYLI